jgi:hypothetical protein
MPDTQDPTPDTQHPPSPARLAANRANAQKSTGPRTPEGKAISSLNSLRHGLAAERAILTAEDQPEYDALRDALLSDLQPSTPRQEILAQTVILAAWRLRRLHRAETGLWNNRFHDYRSDVRKRRNIPDGGFGWVFTVSTDEFAHLCRYEARAERAFYRALQEFEKCRANPIPLPPSCLLHPHQLQ